jgi:hypothetical protein
MNRSKSRNTILKEIRKPNISHKGKALGNSMFSRVLLIFTSKLRMAKNG